MAEVFRPAPALAEPESRAAPPPAPLPEQASSMLERFGILGKLLIYFLFQHVEVRPEAVEHVRELGNQGTVIYVMRYRSTLDYLLVNVMLLRHHLPLARFAPGVFTVWFRPFGEMLRWLLRGRRRARAVAHAACAASVTRGDPVLLFMRNQAVAGRRRHALAAARLGPQYLREVVRASEACGRPVFLVPIGIFRGKGFRRKESRVAALLYSVQEAPGEAKRLFNYLWNAEETQLVVGREIVLARFLEEYRREGEERLVRRLARALQIFLYREERLVWGPTLLPRRLVRRQVLRDPELVRIVRRISVEKNVPRRRIWREARGYFDEMASNYNGLYFGILEFVFNLVRPRVFSGLEILGLERVIDCVKQHPVVLIPSHQSHFDYLILSYIFHMNYLSPPHIAAGSNLNFWPMGPLFRGAGAFFIRRTFEDNELYKLVFRKYLAFLIREGYTQEFFIEGGRTRTGKVLTPRLGMLAAIVNAFIQGVRRDLYFVPISIHYGRIPEEESYRREVVGEEKEPESFSGLLRARKVLKRPSGTAYVSFGEPISLAGALGPARERFAAGFGDPPVEEEKKRFVLRFGFRLLREVNAAAVAGATSISAAALLGAPRAACRLPDFLSRVNTLVDLLRAQGVTLTASLERNLKSKSRESLRWLESGGLVERLSDGSDPVIHVPPEKRFNLDLYKNNTIHFFLVPSLLTCALLAGEPVGTLRAQLGWWLDLYRWEFPLPDREQLSTEIARWLAYYRENGALVGDKVVADHPLIQATCGLLENFREAYLIAARTVASQREWPIAEKALVQQMRKQFRAHFLLEEVRKPEANSVITFGTALSRLAELGYVTITRGGRGAREKMADRGAAYEQLPELIRHF